MGYSITSDGFQFILNSTDYQVSTQSNVEREREKTTERTDDTLPPLSHISLTHSENWLVAPPFPFFFYIKHIFLHLHPTAPLGFVFGDAQI